MVKQVSKVFVPFSPHTTIVWEVQVSTSLPVFGIVSIYFNESSRFKVVPRCGFHLHFLDSWWCWASLVPMDNLHIFFCPFLDIVLFYFYCLFVGIHYMCSGYDPFFRYTYCEYSSLVCGLFIHFPLYFLPKALWF